MSYGSYQYGRVEYGGMAPSTMTKIIVGMKTILTAIPQFIVLKTKKINKNIL